MTEKYQMDQVRKEEMERTPSGRPFSQLLDTTDYETRVQAGEVVSTMLLPSTALKRRVQTVNFIASNRNELTSTVHLDFEGSFAAAEVLYPPTTLDVGVVALLPKSLMFDFHMEDGDGKTLFMVDRRADSLLAMCFLVWLAKSKNAKLATPGQGVWVLLYEHCYKFPRNEEDVRDKEFALATGSQLTGDDLAWWKTACANEQWLDWFLRFHDMFVLLASDPSPKMIVKYRKVSGKDPIRNPGLKYLTARPSRANKTIALRFYDYGLARSEHVHVISPPGTFLTPVAQMGRPRVGLGYRIRASRHEIVTYSRGEEDGVASKTEYVEEGEKGNQPKPVHSLGVRILSANLWPDPRQFVSPLMVVCGWVVGLVLVASLIHFFGWAEAVRNVADAYVAITYLMPTFFLGYIFQFSDETEIRGDLQKSARGYLPRFLGVSLFASGSLFFAVGREWQLVFGTVNFLLFLAMFLSYMHLIRYCSEILEAHGKVKKLELNHQRGSRELLVSLSTNTE